MRTEELELAFQEFKRESDRGAALVAASAIEEVLGTTLSAFMVDNKSKDRLLSGFNAPLGTFSAKISAAHALGLIRQDEYEEIEIIRKIRNEFGHSWKSIDFTTKKIKDLTSNLPWWGLESEEVNGTARDRFNWCVSLLLTELPKRPEKVKSAKLESRGWFS